MPGVKSFETIIWDEKRLELRLLDQRVVPERVRYVVCRTYRDVAEAIRNMTVRGAPAIGVAAAFGVALAAVRSRAKTRESLLKQVSQARATLAKTRPTAVNLFWALDRMAKKAESLELEPAEMTEKLVEEAKEIMEEDVRVNMAIGRMGADLIPDGGRVLTHCN
ncbi:MAG: hypothetical protein QXS57_04345 [Candidatus Caldarchaeum sp.]